MRAERPAVLLVEPDRGRRRELATGLAAEGYEAVPSVSAEEGLRFARGLGPAVIVVRADLAAFDGFAVLRELGATGGGMPRTLVLLGSEPEADQELPEEILYLPVEGLSVRQILSRIRLVLVGREIGLESDVRLQSLVGDLALFPLLELVRSLARVLATARIELERGTVELDAGAVVAARAGAATGVKAFCRLGRIDEGPFRVVLGEPVGEREIRQELSSLVISAIEDGQLDFPDPAARVEAERGIRGRGLDPMQRRIVELAEGGTTVGRLLDAFSVTDGRVLSQMLRLRRMEIIDWREPRSLVRLVTDSTADLSQQAARELGVVALPLTVQFGDRAYRDRVELAPRGFYELLERGEHHPFTNPVPEDDFVTEYRRLLKRQDVVSIHISSRLSETYAHAAAAAEALAGELAPDTTLEVIDSGQVSQGLGLLALFGARMAARGEGAAAIAARLREMAPRVQTLFVVDTLEYLARGGRIGRARALLGKLLGIKPILGLVDGEVEAVDRVRGARAALPRIARRVAEGLEPGRGVMLAVAHSNSPARADRLGALLAERLDVLEVQTAEIGPVVGTHVGPGCAGVASFQPTAEEWPLIAPPADEADTTGGPALEGGP